MTISHDAATVDATADFEQSYPGAAAASSFLPDYDPERTRASFSRLVDITAALRAPGGCPWDRKQTHASIARNAVEEAYEVQGAIEDGDADDLKEELGDLLLQVVLHAQIAAEAGEFTLADVIEGIDEKLIRRHPHVFGVETSFAGMKLTDEEKARVSAASTPEEVLDLWDLVKVYEKREKAARRSARARERGEELRSSSLLDDIPREEPALMQAQDISRKAIAVGFDWTGPDEIRTQLASELDELDAARNEDEREDESGDVLFTLVNVFNREGIDAEQALRRTCGKFRDRMAIMERIALAEGRTLDAVSREELESLWHQAKAELAESAD